LPRADCIQVLRDTAGEAGHLPIGARAKQAANGVLILEHHIGSAA